ncbi:TPA: recombinase family protein [Vibrio parahaemolyticus]|nr:recombinase family protein [Vibrio parahaemolyticus]
MYQSKSTKQTKAYSYLRFSTLRQKEGDSERRQLHLAVEYANRHGLALQGDTLSDLGVSAFRGKNKRDGALGRFIDAVKSGDIDKGSWLLVESVDRISRQEVFDAFGLFSELITNGITVVTLQDNQVYTRESLKGGQIYMLIAKIQTAHEESEKKSKRTAAAWEAAREGAYKGKKIRNLKPPSWLTWDKSIDAYIVIEEKADDVRFIFELAVGGMGGGLIAQKLNARGTPMLTGKPANWSGSNVLGVLRNRAVLGEYTPMRKCPETGKRKPLGNPIPDHYPAIISKEDFYTVVNQIADRNNRTVGYRNDTMKNLFSRVLRCIECSAPMVVKQKNSKALIERYGKRYYIGCSRKLENNCSAKAVHYEPMEIMLMEALSFLPSIINLHTDQGKKITELKRKLVSIEAEIIEHDNNVSVFMDLMAKRPNSQVLLSQLDTLDNDRVVLSSMLRETQAEIDRLTSKSAYQDKYSASLSESNREELTHNFDARVKYNEHLRSILGSINANFLSDDEVMFYCKTEDKENVCCITAQRDFSKWYIISSAGVIAEKDEGNDVVVTTIDKTFLSESELFGGLFV